MTPAQGDNPTGLTLASCATLACLWEATAPKPGNVHPAARFEDLSYAHFVTSAAIVGPILAKSQQRGVGQTVLDAASATRASVATNTNLGTLLLIAPMSAVPADVPIADGIGLVLAGLDENDTQLVYEAIRVANPGGLGTVANGDVSDRAPRIPLVEAMRPAADRDMVAQQYVNGFTEVFATAALLAEFSYTQTLSNAIVRGQLQLLAKHPDSLIARKCGRTIAREAADRAAALIATDSTTYDKQLREFDDWLRADGHRRNPGTTADLIAAALFVLLRDGLVRFPVQF